ncbi:hypothetical protein EXE59_23300 [Nocardioides eburneiflavus]|uniref:WD40 repeat domain-containing protein n=1 Tax=Nocardioides eburneiflavus TaxID=2518372 RepID=A0A4Z1CNK4_9ACTN|nr:hypothetical protein [Nocardioides eburneiflavus]TGN62533.1 hypothetical protein EXE59_00090 [Nocardioides eburneiflavus]TGN66551.1 hypothetical protein EXE59_23300 [Nocardioides eburneiflavus]
MHEDIERMLRTELRQVADGVEVPPAPVLASRPTSRFAWPPVLAVAAAVVLIALVVLVGGPSDRGGLPQPAPQPTDVVTDVTDPLPEAVPTGRPRVPYVLDRVAYVGDDSFPGFDAIDGTAQGWLAVEPPFVWSWGNGGAPRGLDVAVEQPPVVSPNGQFIAYLSSEGDLNGFQTAPDGEGMGLPVPVPVRDDDGVGTRIGAVTDDGWVIASGRGVGVLWRPFDGAEPVDLTRTAPGQLVWKATRAGLVVVDGSGDARDPGGDNRVAGDGRVYLADLTPDGELTPIVDLPHFGIADVSEEWVAWVPLEPVGGEVATFEEILVRDLDGGSQGALSAPRGWRFINTDFTFEDAQFLVARVTDGQQQRMTRCSPALQECVLLEAP